jgi:Uma2 family endonuclease
MHSVAPRGTIMGMEPKGIRYVRPVRPVEFPSTDPEWDMGEGLRHARLCEVIYRLLRGAAGPGACVGADQFMYWDATNPKLKCAPDAFVKLHRPGHLFETWQTWKHGAPELCVEILSPSDTKEKLTLNQKLKRFHVMGVSEVIAYNADGEPGRRLRAWDMVDGDLVERVVDDERTPCLTLDLWFVLAPCEAENLPAALRLARGPTGPLLPTVEEQLRDAQAERQREQAERQREQAERQREQAAAEAALQRIAELEAKLAGRGNG